MNPPTPRRPLDGLLALVASVLLPLGLAVIVLGWYGAAHSPFLWEQVPYLISGGLLGLALVTAAGLLYFGSWVAQGARAQRDASAETNELLRDIRDQLALRPVGDGAPAANGHSRFVATARGSMWHRADCSAVVGRSDVRTVSADGDGLRPCGLCDPLSVVPRRVSREII